MQKITLHLSKTEWAQLTTIVLENSNITDPDKYMLAILRDTLLQVYVKLHNKLHSLKDKNRINLTRPEAAVLSLTLQELPGENYLVIGILAEIDKQIT